MNRQPSSSNTDPSWAAHTGFTLVEVIVAMILIMIAGAMVTTFLTSGFDSERRSAVARKSVERSNKVMDQLDADLRSARSPDRDPGLLGDVQVLRNALEAQANAPANPLAAGTLDVRDLVYADSREIQLRVDAVPRNRQVECVVYFVANDGWFVRQVRTYSVAQRCGPTTKSMAPPNLITSERLLAPRGDTVIS